jgi:hypothetical protein
MPVAGPIDSRAASPLGSRAFALLDTLAADLVEYRAASLADIHILARTDTLEVDPAAPQVADLVDEVAYSPCLLLSPLSTNSVSSLKKNTAVLANTMHLQYPTRQKPDNLC